MINDIIKTRATIVCNNLQMIVTGTNDEDQELDKLYQMESGIFSNPAILFFNQMIKEDFKNVFLSVVGYSKNIKAGFINEEGIAKGIINEVEFEDDIFDRQVVRDEIIFDDIKFKVYRKGVDESTNYSNLKSACKDYIMRLNMLNPDYMDLKLIANIQNDEYLILIEIAPIMRINVFKLQNKGDNK